MTNLAFSVSKVKQFAIAFFLLCSPLAGAYAACCAGHGGVVSCNQSTGFQMCKDGTASPTCTCKKLKTTPAKAKESKSSKSKKPPKAAKTPPVSNSTTTQSKKSWWGGKSTTTSPASTTKGTSSKGCCSRHGGVAKGQCDKATGHQMCNDGTSSRNCMCH